MTFPHFRRRASLVLLAVGLLALAWIVSPPSPRSVALQYPDSALADVAGSETIAALASDLRSAGALRPPALREVDLVLGALDHATLIEKASKHDQSGRFRFATQRDVAVRTGTHGTWEAVGDGRSRWSFDVQSEGATSVNLAFDEFRLPPGASLAMRGAAGASPYVFTDADNDDHGQLWTPIVRGDRVSLALEVDNALAPQMRLALAKVNHGFRGPYKTPGPEAPKIGTDASGSCNVDTVCSAADNSQWGPLVDLYRDQIEAVGAYTLNGVDTCSGTLINNTANDRKPYFLTADHCGITNGNASSMVVYWNFENSNCRTPGSGASGSDGDGPINQFNSGATLRAKYGNSDFCLVELDDPVDPNTEPFWAGWDRSTGGSVSPSAVAIHHPAVSEKRISFELDPTTVTPAYSATLLSSGTHIRVEDWDYGTTEGGSSGSALFDVNGRIIGQLEGGFAACGNNDDDWYGRVAVSWNGGGSSSSRLSDWLDPGSTGAMAIDGLGDTPTVSATSTTDTEGNSGSKTVPLQLQLSGVASDTVSVRVRSTPSGTNPASAGSDFLAVDQVVSFSPGQTQRTVMVTVYGDTVPEANEDIGILLSDAVNADASADDVKVVILNDDYSPPQITSSLTASGLTGTAFVYQITATNTPTNYTLSGAPGGMSVNALTGEINWPSPATGTYNVTIGASNSAGADSETLTVTVQATSLANALDLGPGIGLSTAAPAWFDQTVVTNDGVDAGQSADITDDETSSFSIDVTGPDAVVFFWRVSSEEGWDFLNVSLNGSLRARISGEVGWETAVVVIPDGLHTVTWSYVKDGSESAGTDAGWIDQVTLASTLPNPFITSSADVVAFDGQPFVYQITATGEPTGFGAVGLPSGLTVDPATGRISGSINATGTTSFTVSANNASGTGTQVVSLRRINVNGSLPVAVDAPATPIETDGWFVTGSTDFTNGTSAESADIADSESTSMTAHLAGPGSVSFHWSSSSEQGYDYLSVYLGAERLARISGNVSWEQVTIPLPAGVHEVRWEYAKDSSVSRNDDAGRVDNLQLTGYTAFAAATGLPPVTMLPEADADGDELSNLEEFVFNTNPASPTVMPIPVIEPDGNGVRVKFDGRSDLTGATVILEGCTTLEEDDWEDTGSTMESTPMGGGMAEHRFPIPERDVRYFYRLRMWSGG